MSKYKSYAYIKFELESPLAVGSGDSRETDKDVIRNSKGEPYIPATALTGVYRTFFSDIIQNGESKSEAEKYFGYVDIMKGRGSKRDRPLSEEAALIVYDAKLIKNGINLVGMRNGVGLDQFRTAEEGAKYDFEVVHPGAVFWTAIEYTSDDNDLYPIDKIASIWYSKKVIVGAKSSRGLGRLKPLEIRIKSFALPEESDEWLKFDIFDNEQNSSGISNMEKWDRSHFVQLDDDKITIDLTVSQKGVSPLTIRVYSTDVSQPERVAPDYGQLSYLRDTDGKQIAVIPGTSWAGTFRHSMIKALGNKYNEFARLLTNLFGGVEEKAGGYIGKSRILFSETYFDNGEYKEVSRNAIDRFSGGAADTALFTERMYYGGKKGKLTITIPRDIEEKYLRALAAAVADLHEGLLTVGGECTIGHGLLEIEEISISGACSNLKEMNGATIYRYITACTKEVK